MMLRLACCTIMLSMTVAASAAIAETRHETVRVEVTVAPYCEVSSNTPIRLRISEDEAREGGEKIFTLDTSCNAPSIARFNVRTGRLRGGGPGIPYTIEFRSGAFGDHGPIEGRSLRRDVLLQGEGYAMLEDHMQIVVQWEPQNDEARGSYVDHLRVDIQPLAALF